MRRSSIGTSSAWPQATSGWLRYADTLSERAHSTFDPEVAQDLFVRLGHVAEEKLGNDERAVEAYSHAVEQAGTSRSCSRRSIGCTRGSAIWTKSRRSWSAAWRRELRANPSRAPFPIWLLQINSFKELCARPPPRCAWRSTACPIHEAAVEELEKLTAQPDLFEEAAEALESVYRSRGRTRSAWRGSTRSAWPTPIRSRRGSTCDATCRGCSNKRVKIPVAAQRVIEQGLEEAPTDSALLEEIERLAPIHRRLARRCRSPAGRHREAFGSPAGGRPLRCAFVSRVGKRTKSKARAPRKPRSTKPLNSSRTATRSLC